MKSLPLICVPLLAALSSPASAVVTSTIYNFVATNFSPAAPQPYVPGDFILRYDSVTNQRTLQTMNFFINGAYYSQQNSGLYAYEDGETYALGANINGIQGASAGSNDFVLVFDLTRQSSPIFYYTTSGTNDTYFAGNVQFGEVTPVPEPTTWAMLIGGLGLTGGMMRRRATNVSYATA